MPHLRLCLALAAALLAFPPAHAAEPAPMPAAATEVQAPAKSPWDSMVMIGASLSGGFTITEPLGGPQTQRLKLSRYLDAALAAPHPPIRNVGSALFFMQPENAGRRQAGLAATPPPSLVFAVDFLFWFCYGNYPTDAARLLAFDTGLKLLDDFQCPVIVGDVPDASAAVSTGIISTSQVPDAAVREACNQRLAAWAAKKPNVILVPLARFLKTTMADEAFTIRSHTWPKGSTLLLLQADKLHPNTTGTAAAALLVWDAVFAARPEWKAAEIRWDPAEITRRADEAATASSTTSAAASPPPSIAPLGATSSPNRGVSQ